MNRILSDLFSVTIDGFTGAETSAPNPGVLKGAAKEYSVTVILEGVAYGFACFAQLISDIWNAIFGSKEKAPEVQALPTTPTAAPKKIRDDFLKVLAHADFMGGEKFIEALSSDEPKGNRSIRAVERLASSYVNEKNLKGLDLDIVIANLKAVRAAALANPIEDGAIPEEDAIVCIETLMDQTIHKIEVWKNHLKRPVKEPELEQPQSSAPVDAKKEGIQARIVDFNCVLRLAIKGAEGCALKDDGTFKIHFPGEMHGELQEIKPLITSRQKRGIPKLYAQLNSKAKGAKFTIPQEVEGSINYQDGKVTLKGNGLAVKKGWLPTFYLTEFHISDELEFVFYKETAIEVTVTNNELSSIFSAIKWDQ